MNARSSKNIILSMALFLIGLFGFSQQDEECVLNFSLFYESAKSKNFDAAYEPWMLVRNKCPKYSLGIYSKGEDVLEYKIEKAQGVEKVAYINDLVKLWEERLKHFSSKTPKGQYLAKSCQLQYDNKALLNKTDDKLYSCFDQAYKEDKTSFSHPKSLYTYFSLIVDLYDAKKKSDAELFDKYDDITEKVELEVSNYAAKLNALIEKESSGATLTSAEKKNMGIYEDWLGAYETVSKSIDGKLGDRANCENLIPLYTKEFEANKTNELWLKRTAGKMSEKECTGDPLFIKLVNALHELKPSANSAYYLGILKDKEGKPNEAIKYYKEAISLETDNFKKAKLNKTIAQKLKAKGSYGQARNFFRQALKLNPSDTSPNISIAAMYAASANNCGDTAFNKRAVYWLAANEAMKAGAAGKQSVERYMALAPSKQDVFSCGCSGEVIKIDCWISEVVTVPVVGKN
ncbi:hypothetical protein ICJ85_14975 [Aestuariibaculum marinum]|uniref:Tetratricopeptide repeat protein n=2 Tax=Aestuariibaculum marinum TaxID=2683592 RepID=A0A8J6QE42_9FLAO|nr:hypothetical protein [Aestuariibaculum marinum]